MKTTEKQPHVSSDLFNAVAHLQIDNILNLIKEGENINAINKDGLSVITQVIIASKFDFLTSSNYQSFIELVEDKEQLEQIEKMKKILQVTDLHLKNGKGNSIFLSEYILRLTDFTQKEKLEVLQKLVAVGATVTLNVENNINSPIIHAILNAENEIVKFLLEHANHSILKEEDWYQSLITLANDQYDFEKENFLQWDKEKTALIDGFDFNMQEKKVKDLKIILDLLNN